MENKAEEATDIRHLLAIDRTVYAIERTFFAYVGMSLTLVVSALTFISFTSSPLLKIVAWVFIPCGISIFAVGVILFIKRLRKIKREKKKYTEMYNIRFL